MSIIIATITCMNDRIISKKEETDAKSSSRAIVLLVPAAALIAILVLTTNPNSGGPIMILLFLLAIFLFLFTVFFSAMKLFTQAVLKSNFSVYRLVYVALSMAIGAVFLVGLQTLQQLRLTDILLVAVFEILLNFYIVRRF